MSISQFFKRLIGKEDIAFDDNRNNEQYSDGKGNTYSKINAKHIPLPTDKFDLPNISNTYDLLALLVEGLNVESIIDQDGGVTTLSSNLKIHEKVGQPNANNDSTSGYSLGDIWLDLTPNARQAYICLSDSQASAEWGNITGGGSIDSGTATISAYTDIVVIPGTTYTLLDSDSSKLLVFTSSTDVTVTVPVGLTLGHSAAYLQGNVGKITFDVAAVSTLTTGSLTTIQAGSLVSSFAWQADNFAFAGQLDGAPVIGNIETVYRELTIQSGATYETIQATCDSVGSYIRAGVNVVIKLEDGVYDIGANAIFAPDFSGGGLLFIQAENPGTGPTQKNVRIVGTGSYRYPNFPPYNTGVEDARFLVVCSGANYVFLGDLELELNATTDGQNAAVVAGFGQVSVNECYIKNTTLSNTNNSFGCMASNGAQLNCYNDHFELPNNHPQNSIAVSANGQATVRANGCSGTSEFSYHVNGSSLLAYGYDLMVPYITTEIQGSGTIYAE